MTVSFSYQLLEKVNSYQINGLSQSSSRLGRLWINLTSTVGYASVFSFSLIEAIVRIFTDFLAFFGIHSSPEFKLVSFECLQCSFDSVLLILDTLKVTPKPLHMMKNSSEKKDFSNSNGNDRQHSITLTF